MLENFFKSLSSGITLFHFDVERMHVSPGSIPSLFERRGTALALDERWDDLQPSKVHISKSEMLSETTFKDKAPIYQMGFARKSGLPLPFFPISHSAVCFYDYKEKKFLVLGRQSPFMLNIKDWKETTRIDNEKPYVSEGYEFDAIMTKAKFSGPEISEMIEEANENINKAQLCDMKYSNCYSNSSYMMASGLEILMRRTAPPPKEEVQSVMKTILTATKDHLSIGVLNNEVVSSKIARAFEMAKKAYWLDEPLIDEVITRFDEGRDFSDDCDSYSSDCYV